MIGLTLKDLPFLAGTTGAVVTLAEDDFDAYSAGVDLNTLNGGTGWNAAYVARGEDYPPTDEFDSYANGADLGGLNGGSSWAGAYVSRSVESALDNFDSYADTADLNGLNGGDNWNAGYVSHS